MTLEKKWLNSPFKLLMIKLYFKLKIVSSFTCKDPLPVIEALAALLAVGEGAGRNVPAEHRVVLQQTEGSIHTLENIFVRWQLAA